MSYEKLKHLTLLYVEDDNDTREASATILEDYVGKLIIAKNGKEALDLLAKHQVDLILTDILMPKMNGIEMIKKIREGKINPQIPIVITTAHAETQYLLDAIYLRVDGYILKPIVIADLLDTLAKVVLPLIQARMISNQNLLISAISTFVGGKKIEIIRYLLKNIDEDYIFRGSYESIMETLDVSKPTVVKTFAQLIETGLITKIKNKIYRLHPDIIQNKV
ncbi:response regulator [Helicobacter cholecystus]|uniref:response regulator n=1 Tax=Helicobacter cholecystus TaxID=45498 RepID=UPI0027382404|nr:response regulator [Helicobacter cholecystus]